MLDVTPAALDASVEALTYAFAPDGRALHFRWDRTEVTIPLSRADR